MLFLLDTWAMLDFVEKRMRASVLAYSQVQQYVIVFGGVSFR